MADSRGTFTCRVCLEEDSTSRTMIPIFETIGSPDPEVYSGLCLCVGEKHIKDIDGYPRHICKLCYISLNAAVKFIKLFNESTEVLSKCKNKVVNEETPIYLDFKAFEEYDDLLLEDNADFILQPGKYIAADLENAFPNLTVKLVTHPNPKTPIKKQAQPDPTQINVLGKVTRRKVKRNADTERKAKKVEITAKKNAKKEESVKEKDKKRIIKELRASRRKKQTKSQLCDACGAKFTSPADLKRHIQTMHSKRERLQCDQCPRVCFGSINLQRHIRAQHMPKKHCCSICGKSYGAATTLKKHAREVHDNIRPKVQCHLCDRQFVGTISRTRHIRSVHTGERPEICTFCNKSFTHKVYLREHMRLHTGEKPYSCLVCGKAYPARSYLKSHIKYNHRVSQLDEEIITKLKTSTMDYFKIMKP